MASGPLGPGGAAPASPACPQGGLKMNSALIQKAILTHFFSFNAGSIFTTFIVQPDADATSKEVQDGGFAQAGQQV